MTRAQFCIATQGLNLLHACRPLAYILLVLCLAWVRCTFTIGLYKVVMQRSHAVRQAACQLAPVHRESKLATEVPWHIHVTTTA